MKFTLSFISLITIYILPKTNSQGSQKVPGSISCGYNGALNETCGEPAVDVIDLPVEATSVFYRGILADATLNVSFANTYLRNDENIKNLLNTGRSVFLLYFHQNDSELLNVIFPNSQDDGNNAKIEMANFKTLIEPYNISGIVVNILSYWPTNMSDPYLTENFKIYIEEIRNFFPNFGIGLSMYGYYLIDMCAESNLPAWFDFSELDPCIDFYVIDAYNLNSCTEDFKVGGTNPINGTATKTMEKVRDCASQLGIPDKKSYYLYRATATVIDTNLSKCELTNAKLCALPSLDGYCLDTPQTFYEKGQFAMENGVGVIVWDVDYDDDPHGCCQCSAPYPAFHSIMAGFNGDLVPPVCPLLDKENYY